MMQCWNMDPKERPAFSSMVGYYTKVLTCMSDYMDLNAVSTWTPKSPTPLDAIEESGSRSEPCLKTVDVSVDIADESTVYS